VGLNDEDQQQAPENLPGGRQQGSASELRTDGKNVNGGRLTGSSKNQQSSTQA